MKAAQVGDVVIVHDDSGLYRVMCPGVQLGVVSQVDYDLGYYVNVPISGYEGEDDKEKIQAMYYRDSELIHNLGPL